MKKYGVLLFFLLMGIHFSYAQDACTDDCGEVGLSAVEIAEIEIASLEMLEPNHDLMHDRWYKRVITAVDVYNAPNGTIMRRIEAGFNYVTVIQEADGWTQINADEWVMTSALQEANGIISSFTGILLPESMPKYTIAWALVNMYPSPRPGADPLERLGLIYRYTQLNIYAEQVVEGIRWYQIGAEQWVHQHRVAKVLPVASLPDGLTTERWISIDLFEQVLIAYEGNRPLFATLVATGLPRWPTYEGLFHVYYRTPREYMSWGTVGDDFYALEDVPWTMFFDEGRALHGAYWHDGFGYRRSHGCVNLSITDARWLYDWVAEFMGSRASADREEGPMVYVYASDTYIE